MGVKLRGFQLGGGGGDLDDAPATSTPATKPASKDIYLPPERKPPVVKRRPAGRPVSRRR